MLAFAKHFTQYLLTHNLQHLILHVTNACNFRCQHCFIDFSKKRDLKLPQYAELARSMPKLFWLDIAGGEPFLRKDLADIILLFDARVVQIPSNGSLPDLMVQQILKVREMRPDMEIAVSLSLDGLEQTHEKIRVQPGNWNQVWETFELLRKNDITVKINTVISNDNYHEILDLMEEVQRHKPDFHSIILLRGDPLNPEVHLPPLEELEKMAPDIFNILANYDYGRSSLVANILRNYHKYLWNISLDTIKQHTQVIPCLAGTAHQVVMGNGDVSSCEMLPPVGNIKENSWDEIQGSSEMAEQLKFIKDKKCFCTHNCAMFDSIFFKPGSIFPLLYQTV